MNVCPRVAIVWQDTTKMMHAPLLRCIEINVRGALWLHCGGMSLERLHSIAIRPAKGTEVNTAHLSACQRTGCRKHDGKKSLSARIYKQQQKRLVLHSSPSVVLHHCDGGTWPPSRFSWSKTRRQRCKLNNSPVSIKSSYLYLGEHHIYGDQESSMHCSSRKHLQTARNVLQFFVSRAVDKHKRQEKCFQGDHNQWGTNIYSTLLLYMRFCYIYISSEVNKTN